MKPKQEEVIAVNLEDLNKTYVNLKSGTYLIDGEVVSVSSYNKEKIAVDNIEDIRLVSNTSVDSHYENSGGECMKVEAYNDTIEKLLKNAIYDEYDGYYFSSEFLDDEYKYKKFKRDWKLIKRNVQLISDPIKVEVVKTKYDSGNPFIRNLLKHDKQDNKKILCIYDRPSAVLKILEEYMEKLGFTFVGDKNNYKYDSEWSNSTHSGICYARAFGNYLFGSKSAYSSTSGRSGTLEDCLKWYKQDKKAIEGTVHRQYMEKFGYINEGSFDFDKLLLKLKSAKSSISKVDPKVKTMQDYNNSVRQLRELIEMVESKLEVKKNG